MAVANTGRDLHEIYRELYRGEQVPAFDRVWNNAATHPLSRPVRIWQFLVPATAVALAVLVIWSSMPEPAVESDSRHMVMTGLLNEWQADTDYLLTEQTGSWDVPTDFLLQALEDEILENIPELEFSLFDEEEQLL